MQYDEETEPEDAAGQEMAVQEGLLAGIGELLSVAEAARLFRCSEQYVKEVLIRKGLIPAAYPGNQWIIPKRTLIATLEQMALDEAARRQQRYKEETIPIEPQPIRRRGRPRLSSTNYEGNK